MDFSNRHTARVDPARLRAVEESGLLGSSSEARLDQLTRLAAESLGTAAAFVSIVGADSDYYKSCFGFPDDLKKSRSLSGETFCHFTLVADGVLAIDDARSHPTFRHVPTVESLGVVAYLGVPIRSENGQVLGAFCLIDTKPRKWTSEEIDTAISLARVAVDHLRGRKAVEAQSEAEAFYDFLAPIAYALFLRITHDENASRELLQRFVVAMWEKHASDNWNSASVQAKMLREARRYALPTLPTKGDSRVAATGHSLSNLPDFITETQRRLLSLAYFDGLNVTQIAATLARTEDDVRRDLLGAVQALRLTRSAP